MHCDLDIKTCGSFLKGTQTLSNLVVDFVQFENWSICNPCGFMWHYCVYCLYLGRIITLHCHVGGGGVIIVTITNWGISISRTWALIKLSRASGLELLYNGYSWELMSKVKKKNGNGLPETNQQHQCWMLLCSNWSKLPYHSAWDNCPYGFHVNQQKCAQGRKSPLFHMICWNHDIEL